MCDTVDKYIKQNFYGEELYSTTLSRPFAIVAADLILDIDYSKQNGKWILVHSVIISIPTAAAVTLELIDDQGNTLIRFGQSVQMSGIYHLNHVLESARVKLRIINGSGKMFATAQYQYIMWKDKTRK